MGTFLYKPIGQGQVGGGRANFLLGNTSLVSGGFYDKQGNLVERFGRFQGRPEGNGPAGVKFYAQQPGGAYGQDLEARFTDNSGKVFSYNLPNGGQRYEGSLGDPGSLKAVNKGPMGGGGGAGGSFPGGLSPFNYGAGASPGYLGGSYPTFQPVNFNPVNFQDINAPDYQMVNPVDFSNNYGKAIDPQIYANFGKSSGMALDTLATELRGLKAFEPAAAGLAREQAAIDNLQNQSQRTRQVENTLPGVVNNLRGQTDRAATYATGKLPNSIDDAALQYGIGSRAADQATTRGFGDNSLAGKGAASLMSAEERFKIAQYGEGLIAQNAQTRTALELAPTEYINAGQQIKVTPSVDAGQYSRQYFNDINQLSTLPVGQAFQGAINQSQFSAGQQLDVSKFNASTGLSAQEFNSSNDLQAQQYNSSNQFAASMGLFNYNAGFSSNLAGLQTSQINQQRQDMLTQQLLEQFSSSKNEAQTASTIGSIINGIGSVASMFGGGGSSGGSGGLDSVINGIKGLFGGGGKGISLPGSTGSGGGLGDYTSIFNNINPFGGTSSSGLGGVTGSGLDSQLSDLPSSFGSQFGVDLGQFGSDLGLSDIGSAFGF